MQANLFLLRDGTVLSIFQQEGKRVTTPILNRVQFCNTTLTDSEDASFLLHSLMDAIVDHAGPVMELYADKIQDLETKVGSLWRILLKCLLLCSSLL